MEILVIHQPGVVGNLVDAILEAVPPRFHQVGCKASDLYLFGDWRHEDARIVVHQSRMQPAKVVVASKGRKLRPFESRVVRLRHRTESRQLGDTSMSRCIVTMTDLCPDRVDDVGSDGISDLLRIANLDLK